MEGNHILRRRMAEMGFTQEELAEALNADLRAAGYEGTISDRTVRNWLTGKTRWPRGRQRAALEGVFNCRVVELGFQPPADSPPATSSEAIVQRRRFVFASTGAAIAATGTVGITPAHAARPRVGSRDVERLLGKFPSLIARDSRYGGRVTVESHARELAQQALALQQRGTASQRVRSALYGCAALFTSSAMWAAMDGRRLKAAEAHFDRAASLATLSGDSTIQFRIWSHAGMLYSRLGRHGDALAANDVARSLPVIRQDPMFASLGYARHATIRAFTGDERGVGRDLDHAQHAMDRAAPDTRRPAWLTSFYDQAELEGLAAAAHLTLGDCQSAEAHQHRSLALLRPGMLRNHALRTAILACAQVGQGDVDLAMDTAMSIPTEFLRHPRVTEKLQDFGSALRVVAPSSPAVQNWEQYVHDNQGTTH